MTRLFVHGFDVVANIVCECDIGNAQSIEELYLKVSTTFSWIDMRMFVKTLKEL